VPSVAYDPIAHQYLVAWTGEIGTSNSYEIWAQRLSANGTEVGGSDFQVSSMGPEGSVAYNAEAPSVVASSASGEFFVAWFGDHDVNDEVEVYGGWLGMPSPTLSGTEPAGPANENNPRLKGSVAPDSTVDVFKNSRCLGTPAVDDAPASALNGAGIAVPVADNAVTELSATATSEGRTSRCSNSVAYSEVTPPGPPTTPPPPPPPAPGVDRAPVVSRFTLSPRRFRSHGRSSFRFRLSERATARIAVERSVGRKRFRRVRTLTFRNRPAGANSIAFRARGLRRGIYRATIVATDSTGKRSTPRRASFTIVRR
jgi:hypothetical protein